MSKSQLLDMFDFGPDDEVTYTSNQGTALATVTAVLPNNRYEIEYVRYDGQKIRKSTGGENLAPYFSEKGPGDAS